MFEVLLHTLIDWMRTEEDEDEGRLINHHGKSITVGGKQGMDTVPLVDAVLKLRILLPVLKLWILLPVSKLSRYFCHLYSVSTSSKEPSMNPGQSSRTRRPFTGRTSRTDYANMTQVKDFFVL